MTSVDDGGRLADNWVHSVPWPVVISALVACEVVVVIGVVLVVSNVYFELALMATPTLTVELSHGIVIADLFLVVSTLRGDYQFVNLVPTGRPVERLFNSWSIAVVCLLFILFMTKSSSDFSRAALVISYLVGFIVLGLLRRTAAVSILELAGAGRIAARRTMLVGTQAGIANLTRSGRLLENGMQIVGAAVVDRDAGCILENQLKAAVESGRRCRPAEVMLILDWADGRLVQEYLRALVVLPASINLVPETCKITVSGYEPLSKGAFTGLALAYQPLSPMEFAVKRAFDLVAASLLLLLLSPILAFIAAAIRLETQGPILFRQTRYGFNRRPFEIFKFRSMYASHCRARFRQTVVNDRRVTRVGRIIRKLNLDELPQLINVLRGEMSLVGPRPHPIDLDDYYTSRLLLYARRHNVLPGITGWAQINGFRGVTDEEWKMQRRLLHDLYYLDNWSVLLDMKILVLTVLTPSAVYNAV